MSTELHEKLIVIKSVEGLTNAEFAEKIAVSENTLKGIWKRGSTPKGDILEKVAAVWPEYAFWLITGKEHLPRHISPANKNAVNELTRLVDVIHDVGSLEGSIRAEWFTDLIFLQVSDELNDLAALIRIKQEDRFAPKHASYILINDHMNFMSNGGGKQKLQLFAESLESLGRGDLIRSSSSRLITQENLTQLINDYELPSANICGMDIQGDELRKIHVNFTKWRVEGATYSPKY